MNTARYGTLVAAVALTASCAVPSGLHVVGPVAAASTSPAGTVAPKAAPIASTLPIAASARPAPIAGFGKGVLDGARVVSDGGVVFSIPISVLVSLPPTLIGADGGSAIGSDLSRLSAGAVRAASAFRLAAEAEASPSPPPTASPAAAATPGAAAVPTLAGVLGGDLAFLTGMSRQVGDLITLLGSGTLRPNEAITLTPDPAHPERRVVAQVTLFPDHGLLEIGQGPTPRDGQFVGMIFNDRGQGRVVLRTPDPEPNGQRGVAAIDFDVPAGNNVADGASFGPQGAARGHWELGRPRSGDAPPGLAFQLRTTIRQLGHDDTHVEAHEHASLARFLVDGSAVALIAIRGPQGGDPFLVPGPFAALAAGQPDGMTPEHYMDGRGVDQYQREASPLLRALVPPPQEVVEAVPPRLGRDEDPTGDPRFAFPR